MTMKRKLLRILIDRDPMTKIPKTVAPWEVPVFREQYGEEKVIIEGVHEIEVDELPEAGEEFARMRQVFGINPDDKSSYVDNVYGRGKAGVEALEKAINSTASKADPEIAQGVVDGKAKVSKEVAEQRAAAKRHPVTGERIEDLDKAKPTRAAPVAEGRHEVTISSTAPIRTTSTARSAPAGGDPLATHGQVMAQSQAGFASSGAEAQAEIAAAAAKAAAGEARFANEAAGLASDGDAPARKKSGTAKKSGKRATAKRAK